MEVMTDGLLIAGTMFAGLYCWVLAGRVRALKSLDGGLGGAIVTLTRQIELARATLEEAKAGSRETRADLVQLTARADAAAAQLRLLLAAVEKAGPPARAPEPEPVAAAEPEATPLAARRREVPGPRLVSPPPPESEAEGDAAPDLTRELVREAAPDLSDPVPKPRRMLALDGMLRRRAPAEPTTRSEADLIAALSALAAGGER
ncbi:hypothetical protein [Amaricoccus sp.]|uniref:hypothetical protein n=1 Tax=Amaricoccus sp. TaxID=1872485 RepID=UPI001B67BCCC|nr:hypothetical protein [Amaricoccus sp.]MBP7001758.1 hypothetical protein [Amaricoccus sp.]